MDLSQLLLTLGILVSATTRIDGIQQGTSPFHTCDVVPSRGAVSGRSSLWSTPSQLRLSATGRTGEMALSWVSAATLLNMTVIIGKSRSSLGDIIIPMADIHATRYVKPNGERSPFIYHAVLQPLEPSTRYYYQVKSGGDSGMPTFATATGIYSFVTGPAAGDLSAGYPVRWLFLADHGTKPKSRTTVDAILKVIRRQELRADAIDLLLHGGDMAYGNGVDYIWDEWGKLMEPVTQQLPYMVVAGNHELVPGDSGYENGLPLMHRFQMPYPNKPELELDSTIEGKSLWYSFDWGPVHFIAISTEHSDDKRQIAWLKEDLRTASANKDTHWMVTFGHAPIYTSNIRHGNKTVLRSWLSPLLDQYSVDLSLWGHDHSYERLFPIRNDRVESTSYDQNPGTVHVICGSSGWDLHDCWKPTAMSAFHTATVWGFLSVAASNSTVMRIEFIDSQGLSVVDSVVVRRKWPRRGIPAADTSAAPTGSTGSSTTEATPPPEAYATTPSNAAAEAYATTPTSAAAEAKATTAPTSAAAEAKATTAPTSAAEAKATTAPTSAAAEAKATTAPTSAAEANAAAPTTAAAEAYATTAHTTVAAEANATTAHTTVAAEAYATTAHTTVAAEANATAPTNATSEANATAPTTGAAARYKHKALFIVWLGCGVIAILMICVILRTMGVVPCEQEIPQTKDGDSELRRAMLLEQDESEEESF